MISKISAKIKFATEHSYGTGDIIMYNYYNPPMSYDDNLQ